MDTSEFSRGDEVRTGLFRANTNGYRALQYYVSNENAIFEGDIILDTVRGMERRTEEVLSEARQHGASGIRGVQYRWPKGIILYTIDPALSSPERVDQAVQHWNDLTNLWLIPRTTEDDYVTFTPGDGCMSGIGRRGGQQFIYLAPGCDRGRVIHEIGHTAGLWHEQSRSDRDLYIRILWQNIQAGMDYNFNQHITDGDDIGPYDYGSIMHYPTWAFSRNNRPTIEVLNSATVGQREALSQGDIRAVNTMYPSVAQGKPQNP